MSPSHDKVLSAPGISFWDGGACVGPGKATAAMIEGGERKRRELCGSVCNIPRYKVRSKGYTWGIIIRQESRLLELYPTKVYSEQKGMGDEERVLGNEDKSEQKACTNRSSQVYYKRRPKPIR